jgi:hypothetical protein
MRKFAQFSEIAFSEKIKVYRPSVGGLTTNLEDLDFAD